MTSLIDQIKQQAKEEVARNLLKESLEPEFVIKVTGLSTKPADKLLKKIEKQTVT